MNWFEVTEFVLKAILFLIGIGFALAGIGGLTIAVIETIRNVRGRVAKTRYVWLIYLIGILMCAVTAMLANIILTPWHVI